MPCQCHAIMTACLPTWTIVLVVLQDDGSVAVFTNVQGFAGTCSLQAACNAVSAIYSEDTGTSCLANAHCCYTANVQTSDVNGLYCLNVCPTIGLDEQAGHDDGIASGSGVFFPAHAYCRLESVALTHIAVGLRILASREHTLN
jgi:hypothetical protein